MIDVEADVFRTITAALPSGTVCRSSYQNAPRKFPLVTVEEIGNATQSRFEDSSGDENVSVVSYEVNVFSNAEGAKKKQAKGILSAVDTAMQSLGFERVSCQPTPNLADATIFRITARYRALIDKNKIVYRR